LVVALVLVVFVQARQELQLVQEQAQELRQ
jgi:hypothetical protein